MKDHIVIIGGMGPQASARLHQLIVKGDGAYLPPDEFPMILHASLPVPDFIASDVAEDEAIAMIQGACSRLPLKSAAAIGIACNTAHLLIDRLTNIPKENFVSMIEATARAVAKNGHKKVGLLASPYTIKSKLYHSALLSKGIDVVEPISSDVKQLNTIIHDVVGNVEPSTMRTMLTAIANRLEKQGVDCLLLGCTELPLVGVDSTLPVINSLSCLSKTLLDKHQSARNT